MDWTILGSFGSLLQGITGLIAIGAIYLVLRQTREMTRQSALSTTATMTSIYQHIANGMIDLDMELVRNPSLRKYIYENVGIKKDHKRYQSVMSLVEAYLDFMDLVLVMEDVASKQMDGTNILPWDPWKDYFKDIYKSSPAMREFFSKKENWYSDRLVALFREFQDM